MTKHENPADTLNGGRLPLGSLSDERQTFTRLKTDLEKLAAERSALQKERKSCAMKSHIHQDKVATKRLSEIHPRIGAIDSEIEGLKEALAYAEERVEAAMTAAGLETRKEKAKVSLEKIEVLRTLSAKVDQHLRDAAEGLTQLRTILRDLLITHAISNPSHALVQANITRAIKASAICKLLPPQELNGVLGPHEKHSMSDIFTSWAAAINVHLQKIIKGEIAPPLEVDSDAASNVASKPLSELPPDDAELVLWVGKAKSALAFKTQDLTRREWYDAIDKLARRIKFSNENLVSARTRLMASCPDVKFIWNAMQAAQDRPADRDTPTLKGPDNG
jgi:hypothetical protein